MFGELLGGMIDKEKAISITIKSALEAVSEELECSHKELFIMIKPSDEKMNFKNYIYKMVDGRPTMIREISLKEIIGD
jgi:hypothetical protein